MKHTLIAAALALLVPQLAIAEETSSAAAPPATSAPQNIVWPKPSSRNDAWIMATSGRLQHMTGTVILSLVIGIDGKTSEIKVHTSSGKPELDENVAHAMEHFMFTPGMMNGQPVAMRVLVRWYIDGMLGMTFPTVLHP